MRLRRIILIPLALALVIAGVVFEIRVLTPEFFLFRHKGQKYYAEFADACSSLLAQHPVGTNRFIELDATDVAIPKIIRELHPAKIRVAPDWIWMLHGGGIGFGITWERQAGSQSNTWVLSTTCESNTRVVYVKR